MVFRLFHLYVSLASPVLEDGGGISQTSYAVKSQRGKGAVTGQPGPLHRSPHSHPMRLGVDTLLTSSRE